MATITQTIGSYVGGISQQPDEMKIPGQVNVAKNVFPDVTYGLQKRPGGRLVASISDSGTLTIPGGTNYDPDASATARWFSYYRDEAEQYIGQVNRTGEIRMWKCSDGSPVPVIYDQGTGREAAQKLYLNHYEDNDIQTLTLNDHTYITNRASKKNDGSTHPKTTTAMTALTEPIGYWGKQLFIDLLKISYSSQYALNLFDDADLVSYHTATRIEVDRVRDSKNSCAHAAGNNGAGNAITAGDWPPSGTQPGTTGDGAINWNSQATASDDSAILDVSFNDLDGYNITDGSYIIIEGGTSLDGLHQVRSRGTNADLSGGGVTNGTLNLQTKYNDIQVLPLGPDGQGMYLDTWWRGDINEDFNLGRVKIFPNIAHMTDESFELDLTRFQAQALVYYLRAKISETAGNLEEREYYMRLFNKQMEKSSNARSYGPRITQGFKGMR